jgi:hypothetical protein
MNIPTTPGEPFVNGMPPEMNVVHEGRRRAEAMGGVSRQLVDAEEDPRYPGYHTVQVPRLGADRNAASPIGQYKGMGYQIMSEDPEETRHEGFVLMGIPLDKHIANILRVARDANALVRNYTPPTEDIEGHSDGTRTENGIDIKVDMERSGVTEKGGVSLESAGTNAVKAKATAAQTLSNSR